MPVMTPPNTNDVRQLIEIRLAALENNKGAQETVTVEWRGAQLHIPVISMPVDLLYYNPGTHRIRAQRSIDLGRERDLDTDPYGASAQSYLHGLLMGHPTDPTKIDPSFTGLKDDLREHGQSDPGIITRSAILINGNTRRAALKELGQNNIRVGVLPLDAGHDDIQSIELSLQLRKDHKRDYSFMNFLLAIDERAVAGQLPATIQSDFRIKAKTYERSRWILQFVLEAIKRSEISGENDRVVSLRLVDFEAHQSKLEELYQGYVGLASKAPDDAEALREQRLLAIVLDKSKTDLRLIDPDFAQRYMKSELPVPEAVIPTKIPGTSISVSGPSQTVQALRQLTTSALKAKSIGLGLIPSTPADVSKAGELLGRLNESMVKALDHAGKQVRVVKRRFAAADRVSDACDDLELSIGAVAEARSTGNFDPEDLEEILITLRSNLEKLAAIVVRGADSKAEGMIWLRAIGKIDG